MLAMATIRFHYQHAQLLLLQNDLLNCELGELVQLLLELQHELLEVHYFFVLLVECECREVNRCSFWRSICSPKNFAFFGYFGLVMSFDDREPGREK